MDWNRLAEESAVQSAAEGARKRGFEVFIVDSKEEAKEKLISIIPKNSEVLEVSSTTLNEIGMSKHIDESGDYQSLRKRISEINDEKERMAARKQILSPDYVVGSVHAVTEEGQVLIASASGSQIPPYSYGASNVIWVIGTQKIVKNMEEGIKRIYEHSLPMESERVKKAYNMPSSSVNKILLYEKERPGRIKIIFVRERLGF